MSCTTISAAPSRRPGRSLAALLVLALVTLLQTGSHAQTTDALPYAGGYLVTGNYVDGGVDLMEAVNPPDPVTGLSTGTIHMHGVPTDATIVAAYLYWEAITFTSDLGSAGVPCAADPSKHCVRFRGQEINIDDPVGVKKSPQALNSTTATCWSSGNPLTMTEYKADVLRFLPIRLDKNNQPTIKRLVNDSDLLAQGESLHTVELPTRNGNQVPETAGATLVVIYVNPSEPLRKIVFYDGIYIQPSQNTPTTQTLRGFYLSSATKSAKVTAIGGSGQPNNKDFIAFNDGTNTQISGANPFTGGTASARGWTQNETTDPPTPMVTKDTTYDVSALMTPGNNSSGGYGETATLTVGHSQNAGYDCLSFGAFIFSTAVADTDPANDPDNPNAPIGDGIPDGLENAVGGLKDPDGQPLPNLNAMGASSGHRDLFVEFNAMWAPAGTSWGSPAAPYDSQQNIITLTDANGHHHMPTPADLKMIGDRYAAHGITPHFDVGDWTSYHNLGIVQHGDWVDDYTSTQADGYLVPSGLARGGELIKETACDPASPTCVFPDYPGVVPWRFGVQSYKDFPVRDDGGELTLQDLTNPTDFNWNNGTHRRRFDRNRRGLFHYFLYAHLSGKRRSPLPCLVNGQPAPYDINNGTACTTNNPDYNVPSGRSGISDLAGDTSMASLGRFDEFIGKPFTRASTTFHEIGHNFDLWHGGLPAVWGNKALNTATYFEPNCKPFPTSMSYIYQLHGLYDDDDNVHIDYSNVKQADLTESTPPSDLALSPTTMFRPAWYAPANSVLAIRLGVSAATRYCSGLKFDPNAPPAQMARVSSDLSTDRIDWNGDGNLLDAALPQQDVNFDGTLTNTLYGFNDWARLRLDQMSAGSTVRFFTSASSVSGDEVIPGSGDEILPGSGDELVPGQGDELLPGSGDEILPGSGDELVPGQGDEVLPGAGDEVLPGSGLPELDERAARGLGRSLPHAVKTCVIGAQFCIAPPNPDSNFLKDRGHVVWEAPVFDPINVYQVSRKRGDAASSYSYSDASPSTSLTTSYDNQEQLPNGVQFTFRIRAQFKDQALSGFSKAVSTATFTAINHAPVANPDFYTTTRGKALKITTQASGVLGNDTDDDSPASALRAVLVRGSANGGTVILNADGSFTYTPKNGFTGQDSFTYKANNGMWTADLPNVPISPDSNIATVTITVTAK